MSLLMVPPFDDQPWPSLGGQVCDWIESNLVFGPGDLRGEPAVLDDEKRGLIWRMYEVYPIDHPQAGRRRFKRVALVLPKGTAKTELLAWVAAAELHGGAPVRTVDWDDDGNPIGGPVTDPYIPLVAYTEEQSDELAYGALKSILEESPVSDDFDIGLERIVRASGDGKAVSLASSPNSNDGARTTFQGFDETHWHTLPRLLQSHQTMLANIPKRRASDAWTMEITTAHEPGVGSVAEHTYEYARAVVDGRTADSRLFFFYRYASDEHDLSTEEGARAAVMEASGPSSAWRDIDSIVELWRDPSTDRTYWERVWCNRLVQGSRRAFDSELWKSLERSANPVTPGDLITIGFDGAQFRDSTGLVCTHIETGYQWVAGVWECPVHEPENWQVPAEEVDDVVAHLFETYDVWRMYADPPYWQSWLAAWAGRHGEDKVMEWWTNRRKPMSYALEAFDTAMHEGHISHDGDATLARHIGNSHRQELAQRNEENQPMWLIRKERHDSPHKIDLTMAAVLSWEARTDAIAAGVNTSRASVYESRGLASI